MPRSITRCWNCPRRSSASRRRRSGCSIRRAIYGAQGDGLGNALVGANSRLAAQNIIDIYNINADVRTDFDSPAGTASSFGGIFPVNLEGTTAPGDSGGPIYVGDDIVGDLNGGFNPFGAGSTYGDISIWAPLANPLTVAWLESPHQPIGFVPEPGSLAALLMGLLGLSVVTARRR